MTLTLPPASHSSRELFERSDLEHIDKLPSFALAMRSARHFLATEKGARSVNTLCLRSCGDVCLIEFSRTGHRDIWNFSAAILVTVRGLMVDGAEVPVTSRWEARRRAEQLAQLRGTAYYNLKNNGRIERIEP